MSRIFISYRRDDAAGYAGRLDEALERRLGKGSVFRDVLDIPAGEDFAAVIRQRVAAAEAVLVLIGPRWMGPQEDGSRRIDQAGDYVRLEVAAALLGGRLVIPVLLPGADMPGAAALPEELQALSARNAFFLSESAWDADVSRLADTLSPRRRRPLLIAGGLVLLAMAGGFAWWRSANDTHVLAGDWTGNVRYDWGAERIEEFRFTIEDARLRGTASFLGVPRLIEEASLNDDGADFVTHTEEVLGDAAPRRLTHRYEARLVNDALHVQLQTVGGASAHPPIRFIARRGGGDLRR